MQAQQLIIALVTKVPCNSISKRQDQHLNIKVNYSWQGPARTITGYGVPTWSTWWTEFDEVHPGTTRRYFTVSLPASPSPTPGFFTITDIPLHPLEAKPGYGVKVQVDGIGEWGQVNVLTVTAAGQAFGVTSFELS